MEEDKPREAQRSDLTEQERALILRFEQELESLRGQSDTVILVFGQRLMREIFDAYVGGSPAVRRRLQRLCYGVVFVRFESGLFLEGETKLETLEKRLIWSSLYAHSSDIRDWGMDVHGHCTWAEREGIAGADIAIILRRIAHEYLLEGGRPRDFLLRQAADFEYRDPFERTKRLLADAGMRIARAEFQWSIFGSWFIEIDDPKPVRVVWDGKDHRLVVQMRTSKLAGGTLEWEDRWVSEEPTPDAVVASVLRVLAAPS